MLSIDSFDSDGDKRDTGGKQTLLAAIKTHRGTVVTVSIMVVCLVIIITTLTLLFLGKLSWIAAHPKPQPL